MEDFVYYGFVWDRSKAEKNKIKHGISFEVAVQVFKDPYLCELYDYSHSKTEERSIFIGSIMGDLVLFVVATDRDEKIRVISARKATKKERDYYYENIEKLLQR